jgi:hypothetical protein
MLPSGVDLDRLALETKALQRKREVIDGASLLRIALARGPGEVVIAPDRSLGAQRRSICKPCCIPHCDHSHPVCLLRQETPIFWNWIVRDSSQPGKTPDAETVTWNVTMEDDTVVLDNVEQKQHALCFSVNSARPNRVRQGHACRHPHRSRWLIAQRDPDRGADEGRATSDQEAT